MQSMTVKDLMVPKEEYAAISVDHSLAEAVLALQEAQRREMADDPTRHRDRAVLVLDERGDVVGKISMLDVLACLKPRYQRAAGTRASTKAAARFGSARHIVDSMTEHATLFRKPLAYLVERAAVKRVGDLVRPFQKFETIDLHASMDMALHHFITGSFQSLLVTRNGEIIGVLRLTDVYEGISEMLRNAGH